MGTAITLIVGVIVLAGVYASTNSGLVLLYTGTGVPNFAQGALLMFGAYIASTQFIASQNYWRALVAAAVVTGVLGIVIYFLFMRWLLGAAEFEKVVLTFLVAGGITDAINLIWGTNPRSVPQATGKLFHVAGGTIRAQDLISTGVVIIVLIAVIAFITRSLRGLRMRALAENEQLAVYRGIRVHSLAALAWVIAAVCAGVAGVTYAETASVSLSISDIGLLAFPAAVLGGMDSLLGTILGSVFVAAILTVAQFYLGGVWGELVEYGAMLLTLLVLPHGFFGSHSTRRL
jgi:branched-chain amino acid transport system permease protein